MSWLLFYASPFLIAIATCAYFWSSGKQKEEKEKRQQSRKSEIEKREEEEEREKRLVGRLGLKEGDVFRLERRVCLEEREEGERGREERERGREEERGGEEGEREEGERGREEGEKGREEGEREREKGERGREEEEVWKVSHKQRPFFLNLKSLSLNKEKRERERESFLLLPSFPESERERTEREYPLEMGEREVIEAAISLGDVFEVKRWISRGNDFRDLNPLALVVSAFNFSLEGSLDSFGCYREVKCGSTTLWRRAKRKDYYNLLRLLVNFGEKITKKIIDSAERKKDKQLLPLLRELEKNGFVEKKEEGDSSSYGEEGREEFPVPSLNAGDLLTLVSLQKNKEKKEIWSITIKREPFLIDLSELSLDEEEEKRRKEKVDSFSSIPDPEPNRWDKTDYHQRMGKFERLVVLLRLGDVVELKRWLSSSSSSSSSSSPQEDDHLNRFVCVEKEHFIVQKEQFTPLELLVFQMTKNQSFKVHYANFSRELKDNDFMNCLKLLVQNGGKCSRKTIEHIFRCCDKKDQQEEILELIQDSMDVDSLEGHNDLRNVFPDDFFFSSGDRLILLGPVKDNLGVWRVSYKHHPIFSIDLTHLQEDKLEKRKIEERFSSYDFLPSFPDSEAIRPNKEYPQSMDEMEVILTAMKLVDVYEIRRWIMRGNDVNVKISKTDSLLEMLVKDFSQGQRRIRMKKESKGFGDKEMWREVSEEDYLNAANLLVVAGAAITEETWKSFRFSGEKEVLKNLLKQFETNPPSPSLSPSPSPSPSSCSPLESSDSSCSPSPDLLNLDELVKIGDHIILQAPTTIKRNNRGLWKVFHKGQPYFLDLSTFVLDETAKKRQQDLFSSLLSFPRSEATRPEREYPQTMNEIEIITSALSLGDVYEIKQWIARGNDVNCSISQTDKKMTPLKYLVQQIGRISRDWNSSPTNYFSVENPPQKLGRAAKELDFYYAIEILCQSGAIISTDIMNDAQKLKKLWTPNPKVWDLLLKLDEKRPPNRGDTINFRILCEESKNKWKVFFKKRPFLLDLGPNSFFLNKKEEKRRKQLFDALPSFPEAEKVRPSPEFPHTLSENGLIAKAISYCDVWEIKKWISRGNDLSEIVGERHQATPLERLTSDWYVGGEDDTGTTMNWNVPGGPNITRSMLEERDFVSALKVLVFAGAEITEGVWARAREEASFRKKKKKLLALLEEFKGMENLGRGNFPPPLPLSEEEEEEEEKDTSEENIPIPQPDGTILLEKQVPGQSNLWHVSYNKHPFFLDLSSFSFDKDEEERQLKVWEEISLLEEEKIRGNGKEKDGEKEKEENEGGEKEKEKEEEEESDIKGRKEEEEEKEEEEKGRNLPKKLPTQTQFPTCCSEGDIMKGAIYMADLPEIRMWIVRGGNVMINSPSIQSPSPVAPFSSSYDVLTPLEYLAKQYYVSENGKENSTESREMSFHSNTFSKKVCENDFLGLVEFLVLVGGARVTEKVWKDAFEPYWRRKKTKLISLLVRLENTTLEEVEKEFGKTDN